MGPDVGLKEGDPGSGVVVDSSGVVVLTTNAGKAAVGELVPRTPVGFTVGLAF